jgi:hypothetical protein
MNKTISKILLLSLLLIILCFLSVIIFTLPAFTDRLNLSDKGKIGDAIGGITAPVLGIITSVFLYLTLTKQTESNESQRLKNESDLIFLLLNQLNNEINMFYNTSKTNGVEKTYKGLEGMNTFARTFATMHFSDFSFNKFYESRQFILVIRSFLLIEKRIELASISNDMKSVFRNKLIAIFDCILKYPLSKIIEQVDKHPKLQDASTEEIKTFLEKYSSQQ